MRQQPAGREHADGADVAGRGRGPPPWYATDESRKRSQTTHAPRSSAGPDHARDELGARRGEEQRLRAGVDRVAVEHERAELLAERRAAGLAALDHLAAVVAQPRGQEARLGGLADAVEAFERDEHGRRLQGRRFRPKGTGGHVPKPDSVASSEHAFRLDTGAFRAARRARRARRAAYWLVLVGSEPCSSPR